MFVDNHSRRLASDRWGLPRIFLIIPDVRMTRIFVASDVLLSPRNHRRCIAIAGNAISMGSSTRSTRFFRLVAVYATQRMQVVHAMNRMLIADHNSFRTSSYVRDYAITWRSFLILILIIPPFRPQDMYNMTLQTHPLHKDKLKY